MFDKFKSVFDHAMIGIAICDAHTKRLEMVNSAFAKIHGYKLHELKGTPPLSMFWPQCRRTHFCQEYNPCVNQNGDITFETTHIRKDGSFVPVMVHISSIQNESAQLSYRIINIIDISNRKTIESNDIGIDEEHINYKFTEATNTLLAHTPNKQLEQISRLIHRDPLTALPGRTLAKKRSERFLHFCHTNNTNAAFLFINLDGFKVINNTFGHSIGDLLLKETTSKLKNVLGFTDSLCRLGGDEFLIILPNIHTSTDIKSILYKIFDNFKEPLLVLHHRLSVTMSIGIAMYPEHGESFESLLQKSDTAMYHAKNEGKNGYSFFTEQMEHDLIGQYQILNDLKSAINEKQFVLYFQPQINVFDHKIIGAEALIRWEHPQLGMVAPMQFIPIAEENGLIVHIGEWVIREACRMITHWHQQGIKITIAINISALQLKRGNLYSSVQNALETYGCDPSYLELELTESILVDETEQTFEMVKNLKNMGLKLSIDDFGTGYSSLAYLRRFAVDKLKIDQSFFRDSVNGSDNAVIVKSIIQMAKNLNLTTIAEGVEDSNVLTMLQQYECDEVQGYHFSKPLMASAFETFYKRHPNN